MDLERILVPTDFSEPAAAAVDLARALAARSGARLHLLHGVQLPVELTTPISPAYWEQVEEAARRRLAALQAEVEAAGVACASQWLAEAPARAIATVAGGLPADLVVMGTRGATGLDRVLFGSVAERTVRSAPCPVITVHERPARNSIETVLVAVDFSDCSARALETAIELAALLGSPRFVLVHAHYVPPDLEALYHEQSSSLPLAPYDAVAEQIHNRMVDLRQRGIECDYVLDRGSPDQVIVAAARESDADLIAIGTHGRRGFSHLVLGSVAERIVRSAPCPVLTVRMGSDAA